MSKIKSTIAAITIIILFSVAFIYLYGNQESKKDLERDFYNYNYYTFVKDNALWKTQVQAPGTNRLYTIAIHYGPLEVEGIKMVGRLSKKFIDADYAYITVDPAVNAEDRNQSQLSLAAAELSIIMVKAIDRTPIGACTENVTETCEHRPIIPCKFEGEPVIYLKNQGNASIIFNGDCIILSGQDEGIVRSVDRLLLYWLGIQRQRTSGLVFN